CGADGASRVRLSVSGIVKRFGAVTALAGIDLTVEEGEFLTILGPSGSGKTTLLKSVAGFEVPDEGQVLLGDQDVTLSPARHRNVGMVFQNYALFPHMTVAENVAFPLEMRRVSKPEIKKRVGETLALVELEAYGARLPRQLSGGQQQRVALARALAPAPEIVLLDEPFSAIDPLQRGAMREELARILDTAGTTVLLVTHDQEEALALADRVALMRDGAIVQVDAPERLYHEPVDRWSAEFVGTANVLGRAGAAALGVDVSAPGEQVLVRPELVQLDCTPGGAGEVVGREFRGHDVMYRVRLGDGTLLWSQRPSNELVPLGSRVHVHVHAGPVPVFL
ncbi:MAG: attA2, partial [Solirubrobacterales bacterium]|nr:attA2 [Solirubrobacterales bacterium]